MTSISGTCDPRFAAVRDALSEQLELGDEYGAAICVRQGDRVVVDIWGGLARPGEPWGEHTLVNVWSCTKTVTNLAALVLASRGELDPYAPVAKYWPEFAANGKEGVEVRHLLSHTSGVSGWERPCAVEDIYDWDTSVGRLAAQPPWWEPGTASGYHALNQGHLVGEVIQRISGRRLRDFVDEELAQGADFRIGCAPADVARVAPVIPPPPLPIDFAALDPSSVMVKTFTGPLPDASCANTDGWRAAQIGAANGHGNARSLVDIQSRLTSLLSADAVDVIFDRQSDGPDLVLGVPLRFGIGYGLPEPTTLPYIPAGRICFWGGWGGSLIIRDLDRDLTIGYVMNRMAPGIIGSPRAETYLRAVYGSAG